MTPVIYAVNFIPQSHDLFGLLSIFRRHNIEIRIVGGFVRDQMYAALSSSHVCGRYASDLDLAAASTPERIEEILKQNNISILTIGKRYGTICAIYNDVRYEITSLRCDEQCDGRYATVRFGASFALDARRRDFTINAMSYCPFRSQVYDYFGGIEDLKNRRVIFIDNASQRVAEDYLRILRFIRFSLRFAVAFDLDGTQACKALFHKLELISKERVKRELDLILSHQRLEIFIDDIQQIFDGGENNTFVIKSIHEKSNLSYKSLTPLQTSKLHCNDRQSSILQEHVLDFKSLKRYFTYTKMLSSTLDASSITNDAPYHNLRLATIYAALLSRYLLHDGGMVDENAYYAQLNQWKFSKQQAKQVIALIVNYIYLRKFASFHLQRRLTIIANYIWYKYYPYHNLVMSYILTAMGLDYKAMKSIVNNDEQQFLQQQIAACNLPVLMYPKSQCAPPKCPYTAKQLIEAGVQAKDIQSTLMKIEEEWIVNEFYSIDLEAAFASELK